MTVNGLGIKQVEFILRSSSFAAAPLRRMDTTENGFKRGFTLVETLITTIIVAIITLGALSSQYHAARHGRIAEAQIIATRTAQLLLEDWKSTGGSLDYDPTSLQLGFTGPLQIPSLWSQGQGVGQGSPLHNAVYSIAVNGLPMQVMLIWVDVETDSDARATLRELIVIVRFAGNGEHSTLENLSPLILTTYVRIDGTSG